MKTYRRPYHVPWREIENKAILISVPENEVIVLNVVGTEIWKFIESAKNFNDIVNYIISLFEIDKEGARKDVDEFLTDLQKRELLDVK